MLNLESICCDSMSMTHFLFISPCRSSLWDLICFMMVVHFAVSSASVSAVHRRVRWLELTDDVSKLQLWNDIENTETSDCRATTTQVQSSIHEPTLLAYILSSVKSSPFHVLLLVCLRRSGVVCAHLWPGSAPVRQSS